MEKKTIRDIDTKELRGKKILVRCDFNVPLKDGEITDDTRIRAALPTIRYLLESGAKVVLCSHLGRPKGEVNEKYSMKPVAERLSEELDAKVKCAEDVTGPSAKDMANELKEGEVYERGVKTPFTLDEKEKMLNAIINGYEVIEPKFKFYNFSDSSGGTALYYAGQSRQLTKSEQSALEVKEGSEEYKALLALGFVKEVI